MLRDGISAEEIAKEGNVNLEAVVKLREHSIKAVRVVELLKELKSPKEIGEECQCSQAYVYMVKENNKIYLRSQVIELIKAGESPEDIATEGNVNLEAVINLREELKKSSKREKEKTPKVKKIIELSKDLIGDKEIAERLGSSKEYVCFVRNSEGIYSRRRAKQLIKEGKTPEEIEREGNVNLDAVIRLKVKLENESYKKAKIERGKTQKKIRAIELAKDLKDANEIAEELQTVRTYVYQIMSEEEVYSRRRVKQLIKEGKTPEEIAREGNVYLGAVIEFKNKIESLSKRRYEITSNTNNSDNTQQQKAKDTMEDEKTGINIQKEHRQKDKIIKEASSTSSKKTGELQENSSINKSESKNPDKTNNAILQMARRVKSVDKIVAVLGIPEYTIRNLLRKNNILPREDIISLINKGEKTLQEIAQESGVNLKALEGLNERIVQTKRAIANNPKRKRAIELLQMGKSESDIVAITKLRRETILEMKELIMGRVEKPISAARQQADFKLDMFNLRSSINAMQQHSSRIQAETTDLKIQKILAMRYGYTTAK